MLDHNKDLRIQIAEKEEKERMLRREVLEEGRKIRQNINELCKKENLEYFETSAKNNTGIKEGFTRIASLAYKTVGNQPNPGVKLNVKKKKKSKC